MIKNKPRLKKGTLVASTNKVNRILSKRFIVNVYYKSNYKSLNYVIREDRTSINQ